MSATPLPAAPFVPPYFSQQLRRYLPLAIVIALHVAFFYALRSGMLHQAAKAALPKEIYVKLISEEPAPQPRPQPAEPKTVPVVKKTVPKPKPKPIIKHEPSPKAISEPTPPPQAQPPQPPAEAAPPAPPAPAAPSVPATPKIISGVAYVNAPRPVYPPLDARMGNEGTVTLRVLINEKGRAEKIDVQKSSGSLRMDDAARDAVMRALFKPYIEDGKAIPVYAIIPINFTLSR
ncbi:MAG TPA: energy transducer TonB [Oxalicibacterium sp.]|nr:energy transducer TonB [Oxalicibacterium sp.]